MELSNKAKKIRNAYQREWRKKNPDKETIYREYQREWRKKNPDKIKKYNQNYWEHKAFKQDKITNQIFNLHKSGLSLRKIAEQTGFSHMKIKRILDDIK
jgi:hypothetical protein